LRASAVHLCFSFGDRILQRTITSDLRSCALPLFVRFLLLTYRQKPEIMLKQCVKATELLFVFFLLFQEFSFSPFSAFTQFFAETIILIHHFFYVVFADLFKLNSFFFEPFVPSNSLLFQLLLQLKYLTTEFYYQSVIFRCFVACCLE